MLHFSKRRNMIRGAWWICASSAPLSICTASHLLHNNASEQCLQWGALRTPLEGQVKGSGRATEERLFTCKKLFTTFPHFRGSAAALLTHLTGGPRASTMDKCYTHGRVVLPVFSGNSPFIVHLFILPGLLDLRKRPYIWLNWTESHSRVWRWKG